MLCALLVLVTVAAIAYWRLYLEQPTPGPFERRPYVVRLGPTSAELKWRIDQPIELRAVGPDGGSFTARGGRFDGLSPGVRYGWTAAVDGLTWASGSFRTAPADPGAAVTFGVIGDFGSGDEPRVGGRPRADLDAPGLPASARATTATWWRPGRCSTATSSGRWRTCCRTRRCGRPWASTTCSGGAATTWPTRSTCPASGAATPCATARCSWSCWALRGGRRRGRVRPAACWADDGTGAVRGRPPPGAAGQPDPVRAPPLRRRGDPGRPPAPLRAPRGRRRARVHRRHRRRGAGRPGVHQGQPGRAQVAAGLRRAAGGRGRRQACSYAFIDERGRVLDRFAP